MDDETGTHPAAPVVELLWIPLGAGASVVRFSGRAFELLCALVQQRPRRDLFHSALRVTDGAGTSVLEMTPCPDGDGAARGVVAGGVVGSALLGRFRVFRYEIHCWRDGVIPDAGEALGGPVTVSHDPEVAARILALAPLVPTPVWGRDELGAGEMWNSNSVTSWLLIRAGVDVGRIALPPGGRAPGWGAGITVGRRRS